jgi:hypothetical protein
MYLRPFLMIQIIALLTVQIWAYFRLRSFGLEFMAKLQALAHSGYIPIPLHNEMSDYLHIASLIKAGSFFTFTLGFTLGVVAFGGSFCLNRYKFSRRIRLGWTVLIPAFFSFLIGFSPLEFVLFTAFFGLAHMAVKIPDAPFHKIALFSLIPLMLILIFYQDRGFLLARDHLLQNSWGRKVVTFYYRYSPVSAELITPPSERVQVTIWTVNPLGRAEKSWLLKRGIYTVSTRKGADLVLPGDLRKGPAIFEAIRKGTAGRSVKRLRETIGYSMLLSAPLAIMLFILLATDRLLTLSKHFKIVLLLSVTFLSALLIYRAFFQKAWEPTGTLPNERVEDIRHWALWAEKTGDMRSRTSFLRLLGSNNPGVRLWAATALAYLPSKENVERLTITASRDPIAIVRCKAIFALSHQGVREVIPYLEARLKEGEDWYVKHYLLRALRRLEWIE